MVLGVVAVTRRLLGLPCGAVVAVVVVVAEVEVADDVGPAPMVAVNSGEVTPPPRIEYT